jgi:hypothetical protein
LASSERSPAPGQVWTELACSACGSAGLLRSAFADSGAGHCCHRIQVTADAVVLRHAAVPRYRDASKWIERLL